MRPETDVALRAALAIAAEQHGAISVAQLRAGGLSARAQRAAVADGHLSQVEPTVLVVQGSPDTWFRRLQVGLLALGPQACVSHEAAAQLLGLRIKRDGQHVARVDFLYADERMVIEVTGRLGHSTPADRGRDAQRRNELQDLGYAVYEYTYGDVTRRRDYVVTTLRQRLAARRPVPVT